MIITSSSNSLDLDSEGSSRSEPRRENHSDVAIPSAVVQDSLYPFHKDDTLDLEIDPKTKTATLHYSESAKKTR